MTLSSQLRKYSSFLRDNDQEQFINNTASFFRACRMAPLWSLSSMVTKQQWICTEIMQPDLCNVTRDIVSLVSSRLTHHERRADVEDRKATIRLKILLLWLLMFKMIFKAHRHAIEHQRTTFTTNLGEKSKDVYLQSTQRVKAITCSSRITCKLQ